MDKITLGIVGGCLSTGYGIVPLSAVYHRVLAKEVQRRCGVKLRVRLSRQSDSDPVAILEEAKLMLEKRSPDAMLFQIRPSFVWGQQTFFWLRRDTGLSGLRLNPYLFGYEKPLAWSESIRPTGKIRPLNWALGRACGLQRSAERKLFEIVEEVRQMCLAKNCKLFLMGPIFGPWYMDSFVADFRRRVNPRVRGLGIPYLDPLDLKENPLIDHFIEDGLHLTTHGHKRLSDLVFGGIEAWCTEMKGLPAKTLAEPVSVATVAV